MVTLACPMCGGPLLVNVNPEVSTDPATAVFTLEMTDDASEHIGRCAASRLLAQAEPKPLWMRCSRLGCTWRSEFAAPSQDWNGYVHGVVEGATHMRTVHNDEPAAQQIERWLLDQARQAGRAVEGHRA